MIPTRFQRRITTYTSKYTIQGTQSSLTGTVNFYHYPAAATNTSWSYVKLMEIKSCLIQWRTKLKEKWSRLTKYLSHPRQWIIPKIQGMYQWQCNGMVVSTNGYAQTKLGRTIHSSIQGYIHFYTLWLTCIITIVVMEQTTHPNRNKYQHDLTIQYRTHILIPCLPAWTTLLQPTPFGSIGIHRPDTRKTEATKVVGGTCYRWMVHRNIDGTLSIIKNPHQRNQFRDSVW